MYFCGLVMLLQRKKIFGNPENRLKKRAFCEKNYWRKSWKKMSFDTIVFCYQTYFMT